MANTAQSIVDSDEHGRQRRTWLMARSMLNKNDRCEQCNQRETTQTTRPLRTMHALRNKTDDEQHADNGKHGRQREGYQISENVAHQSHPGFKGNLEKSRWRIDPYEEIELPENRAANSDQHPPYRRLPCRTYPALHRFANKTKSYPHNWNRANLVRRQDRQT